MNKSMKRVLHNGELYYSVSAAATYLRTTADKVRSMMGDGSLKWTQFRENGNLYITAQSLVEKQKALLAAKK